MSSTNPTVAIIGATGATGKYLLLGAIKRGYNIKVLARNPKKLEELKDKIQIVEGSVEDIDAVTKLADGADVILSTLGTTKKPHYIVEKGVNIILQAVQSLKTKPRFIHMSAVGLGDSKEQCKKSWLWRFIVKVTFPLIGRELFADMERAENLIINSNDINFVILRAAVLNDKPARGYKIHSVDDSTGPMFVSRIDVANFMLDVVFDNSYDNQAISLFSA